MKIIVKKISKILILILAISFLSFFISYVAPGDAAQKTLESTGVPASQELLEEKRRELGLDDPMPVQYWNWLKKAVCGDLGNSFKSGKPVIGELLRAMPNTLLLSISSIIAATLLSIPIALVSAGRKNGVFDRSFGVITYILISFPSFFTSLVFLYLFAGKLGWFRIVGGDRLIDAVLPVAVLSVTTASWMVRQIRTLLLKEYKKEYVAAYRAKGAAESHILRRHVLKNCMLPIITIIGLSFAAILGGTLIVENIFNWSGMGQLMMRAISYRDYPMIQGYVLFMAIALIAVNGLTDVLYYVIDPRSKKIGGEMLEK